MLSEERERERSSLVPSAKLAYEECSGVMARLVWARNQPMVSRYIIACLDRMSC